MTDDAAVGAALVVVIFIVAVTQGVWLLAVPLALVLALVVMAVL